MRGKVKKGEQNANRKRDHPRTCGEKVKKFIARFVIRGSPPHMRGKGVPLREGLFPLRITPAHAGKRYIHPKKLYVK